MLFMSVECAYGQDEKSRFYIVLPNFVLGARRWKIVQRGKNNPIRNRLAYFFRNDLSRKNGVL